MAGHTRDYNVAFQSAEAALRDARRDLNSIAVGGFAGKRQPTISGTNGFGDLTDQDNGTCGTSTAAPNQFLGLCRPFAYDRDKGLQPRFNATVNLTGSPSVRYATYTNAPLLVGVSQQPRYFIEVLCYYNVDESLATGTPKNFCNYYRITARGYGGNPNTQATLQEIFLKTP